MSKLPRMDAMELVRQPTAFSHKDWIYEIKYDGIRGLAYVQDATCQLVSQLKDELLPESQFNYLCKCWLVM